MSQRPPVQHRIICEILFLRLTTARAGYSGAAAGRVGGTPTVIGWPSVIGSAGSSSDMAKAARSGPPSSRRPVGRHSGHAA